MGQRTAGDEAISAAEQLFTRLRDFKHLEREKALESFRAGLTDGTYGPEDSEPLALAALDCDTWEARQGGLAAAAEMVHQWDRPAFRKELLECVPRLLVDLEYRVRKAVAPVLKECCQRDGLAVYDGLATVVLGDIRGKFQRTPEDDKENEDIVPGPPAPPKFLPDTEGWRSLETSMGALEAMMQGCGTAFTPRISGDMLDLLTECSKHTNRFVREYSHFSFRNVFEVCSQDAFLEIVGPATVDIVAAGIRDNWSQVRYASSTAARAFMRAAGEGGPRFHSQLLGPMCLNRHYVAEGVRLYSQDTWREVCGPQGGARLLVANIDSVLDAYVAAAEAPNHAVREAACHCISELAVRVAGTPQQPTSFRGAFTQPRVHRLLQVLLASFEDESWPVRDVASTALGHFVGAFPLDSEPLRVELVDLWFAQMRDNIPSMRKNGAKSYVLALEAWGEDLWDLGIGLLAKSLRAVENQPEHSDIFSDYTPSGPFSVPKPRSAVLGDTPDPEVTDQVMYSCGSVAPKTFRRRRAAQGGCMNCTDTKPHQLWEASEGMVQLLAELAAFNRARESGDGENAAARKRQLTACLGDLTKAFECSHYRHHHVLKQSVCDRLPGLTMDLGIDAFVPHLPKMVPCIATCAAQAVHPGLREAAKCISIAWQAALPPKEWDRLNSPILASKAADTACTATP